MVQKTDEAIADELNRKGHFAFNWDDLDKVELPTGVITSMYKVGDPREETSPTVFKVYFPPESYVEAHTHDCDYTEILLEGTQRVGATWHKAGDVRIGLANRGYGPLVAGPEGATVLFMFKDGRWPAITLGNNDGSTLGSDVIADHYDQKNSGLMTMSNTEADADLMQLARRALGHQQHQTTDLTDSILRVPIGAYTDEARYSAEKSRIFKTLPLALALSLELPEPGDYKTIFALETPVLLVRGDDGVVRAFLNVCRHRGARVCETESGNARNFPCPYHAWTYGRQGELVSRYAAQLFGDVEEENLGLTSLGCAEASGIVWVTLNASEPIDIDGWLGDMKTRLDTLKLDEWHLYEKRELPGPGWKVTMDGYLEIYHHNVVHGATVGQHTIGNLLVLDTYGPHQRLTLARKSLGTLKETPEEDWEPLEHIRLVHNCFPNLSISGILGDHCLVSQVFPGETPDSTVTIQMVLCAHEPKTKEDIAAAENFSAMVLQAVQDEDYRLGLLIQQGIKSGANNEFLFGKNEPAAQNYHRWVAQFMEQGADMNWGA